MLWPNLAPTWLVENAILPHNSATVKHLDYLIANLPGRVGSTEVNRMKEQRDQSEWELRQVERAITKAKAAGCRVSRADEIESTISGLCSLVHFGPIFDRAMKMKFELLAASSPRPQVFFHTREYM